METRPMSHHSVEIDVYFNKTNSSEDVKYLTKLLNEMVLKKYPWVLGFDGEYVDDDEDENKEWFAYVFELDPKAKQDLDAFHDTLLEIMKKHQAKFPESGLDLAQPSDWTYDGQIY